MRPRRAAVELPRREAGSGAGRIENSVPFNSSSRRRPSKLSMKSSCIDRSGRSGRRKQWLSRFNVLIVRLGEPKMETIRNGASESDVPAR
jgi:hypothetical protein